MKIGEGTEKLSSMVTSPCDPLGDELLQGQWSREETDHKGIEKGLDLYGSVDESEFMDSMDMGEEWIGKVIQLQNTSENCDKLFESTNSCESAENKNSELVGKEIESFGTSDGSLEIRSMGIDDDLDFLRDVKTMGGSLEGSRLQSGVEIGGAEFVKCSDDSETSSKYEHSDGEDSMFGGSTNDEKNINSYYGREVHCSLEENDKAENKLVMGSAIAFGLDDWDDFTQENGEFTLSSMVHEELQPENQPTSRSENECLNITTTGVIEYSSVGLATPKEEDLSSNHEQGGDNLINYLTTCSVDPLSILNHGKPDHVKDENAMLITNTQIQQINESAKFFEQSCAFKLFNQDRSPQTQIDEVPIKEDLKIEGGEGAYDETLIHIHDDLVSGEVELKRRSLSLEPISHPDQNKYHSSTEPSKDVKLELSTDQISSTSLASVTNDNTNAKSTSRSVGCSEYHLASKTQNLEVNELYDELVHDMEEILLESGESLGFNFGNKIYQSYIPLPSRDGGSTASTSGTDDAYAAIQNPLKFDRVEVIDTIQKIGDVSLSERLVGVREYTAYRIRVWSGKDKWEVEKRYREFSALYWRLKKLFADQGRILPSVWSSVEQESRKVFRSASPKVVADRSVLIQECLNSLLQSRFPTGALNVVVCFLSLSKDLPGSPTYDTNALQSPSTLRSRNRGNVSSLGKTISLIVNKRPYKSNKQLLDEQHYSCAGCYKNFDDGKTRIQELAQTMGWGKPRFCEYSGQLYCSSCHTNDTAVLPARILHLWDFNQYPVSQMAKSYLDSIYDQPMLCVSAVNPFLFSKVPALQHVTNIRKRIGTMLPFVRCSFQRSIYRGVGSRRYLLESNDFFSLRDLIDLSKGVFAALPVMVETISRKILEHIAEQCLICCDVGIPCNARQACDDPSSLIFPFQEEEIERCKSCQSVFHKHCFRRTSSCPCGTQFKPELEGNTSRGNHESSMGNLSLALSGKKADLSKGLFSRVFSKVRSLKSSEGGEQQPEDKSTAIVMGLLPLTNL
ncbi:uncharacterized protein [Solanum lycopersicum]|uniref:PX domain-containing protein n=1 Tax=Solanum lycopersicum TaxID=4081 RepID=A0A3Q7GF32_SOLLC|nr:uncharacterized protein LOC101254472 [Solanum lycopersicum]XP_010318985.1 uncharacterized protein LOC101254472 [Solanum lycopersicum]XP_010318986.1 uncharacterized protein LOC101254472 [Solanum lycopersicum]